MSSKRGSLVLFVFVFASVLTCAGTARAAMVQQWVASYNGIAGRTDAAYDVQTDAAGNVYVTGYSDDNTGAADVFVAKYDPTGAEIWTGRWDGLTHEDDIAYSIAVDAEGNVYVAGSTMSGGQLDALLVQFDADGDQPWLAIIDGGQGDDAFNRVALDGSGNVYVAGYMTVGVADTDYLLAKFDTNGTKIWEQTDGGPAVSQDYATGLAVDSAGNAYVNGRQDTATSVGVALLKYNPAGMFQWKEVFTGTGGAGAVGGGAVAGGGGVFYSAALWMTGTAKDIVTAFVNADNNASWMRTYDGAQHVDDEIPERLATVGLAGPGVRDLAIGPNDEIFATGSIGNLNHNRDILTIECNSAGEEQWTAVYNIGSTRPDISLAIAVDAHGNAFVGGRTTTNNIYDQYLTLMYDKNGNLVDSQLFDAPGAENSMAQNITVDPDGNPVITGVGWQGDTELDNAYTVKYCVGCVVNGYCYAAGASPEGNICLICNPAASQTGLSNNDGAACDDALFCNGGDTCAVGACSEHAGDPCPPETPCDETTDQCLGADDDAVDDDAIDDDATDDDTTGGGGDGGDDDDSGCGC